MGIRKRVILGFILLGSLLFIAGVISYFEHVRLNESTLEAVDKGAESIQRAKELLDLLDESDDIVVKYIDSLYTPQSISINNVTELTNKLVWHEKLQGETDNVIKNAEKYIDAISNIPDSLNDKKYEWYFNVYREAYRNLNTSIKNLMIHSQQIMVLETRKIKNNTYRATMQGIIALAAGIVIIIMFFFLIDIYFVTPVINITRSLRGYILHKTPFNPEIEGKEEVALLKEYIVTLIEKLKNSSKGV